MAGMKMGAGVGQQGMGGNFMGMGGGFGMGGFGMGGGFGGQMK